MHQAVQGLDHNFSVSSKTSILQHFWTTCSTIWAPSLWKGFFLVPNQNLPGCNLLQSPRDMPCLKGQMYLIERCNSWALRRLPSEVHQLSWTPVLLRAASCAILPNSSPKCPLLKSRVILLLLVFLTFLGILNSTISGQWQSRLPSNFTPLTGSLLFSSSRPHTAHAKSSHPAPVHKKCP